MENHKHTETLHRQTEKQKKDRNTDISWIHTAWISIWMTKRQAITIPRVTFDMQPIFFDESINQ